MPIVRSGCSFFCRAALLLAGFAPAMLAQSAVSVKATATLSGLAVTVSCHSDRPVSGHLNVSVLGPEDEVLAQAQRDVDVVQGDPRFKQELRLAKPLPLADLVWQRVRYSLQSSDDKTVCSGIDQVSGILLRPVVHILGQKSYLAGSRAAVRVLVRGTDEQPIAGKSSVRIELLISDKPAQTLFTGPLEERGTADAQFRFPADLAGTQQLHYIAETPLGVAEYTQTVQLEDKASILLTTEKPIYQPGQAIHVRALALRRVDRHAAGEQPLTFELEDSRGNKVFKKITRTDKFGIASADFELADEVNLGTYHVRALMGDASAGAAQTAEIALNVERYVLPKFRIAIDFDKKDGKPRRDYRPGDHVVGTVRANYFFGKPVDGAAVEIKASSADVSVVEDGKVSGKADKDGAYHFNFTLPKYFAGRATNQGAAQVLVEATVKDSADQSEVRGEPITVSQSALLITAVPEGGTLIPHLENQVFVLTSYPDGTPAKTGVTVHLRGSGDQHAGTDSGGVAVVLVKADAGQATLQIDADDHQGSRASASVPLQSRYGNVELLLRMARALYRVGDPMQLKIFSTEARGAAYIDVVKDGQTILTRDVDIANGEADLDLTVTPEMAGTLRVNAYLFGRDAQPVGDHRLVFVQPADELMIETKADAAQYKPGGDARIHFHVTNARGQGVSAALGLQVVDEAVFALTEKQPGFAKVFFYLEQEVMKPRYEIHSLSMEKVIGQPRGPRPMVGSTGNAEQEQDQAARALFAATESVDKNKFEADFGKTLPQEKRVEYTQQYQAAFTKYVTKLAARLDEVFTKDPHADFLASLAAMTEKDGSKLHDAWGSELDARAANWNSNGDPVFEIRSPGPDRQLYTADDLVVYLVNHPDTPAMPPAQPPAQVASLRTSSTLDVAIQHDRGAFNGRAEVTGTVHDPGGAAVPGATVELKASNREADRSAKSDASGQFTFTAVPRGSYSLHVSAAGFEVASAKFEVLPRDRAIASTVLMIGKATTTVDVSSALPPKVGLFANQNKVAVAGFANGVVGGVPGGVGAGRAGVAAVGGFGAVVGAAGPAVKTGGFGLATSAAQPMLHAEDAVISTSFSMEQLEALPGAHVRSYFPESLYVNPEILTDGKGNASIVVPVADSITTWRMAMLASTEHGALGSSTSSLKVFQDFFVDLDLPVTLTQGDKVSIPVAVYNYSGHRGDVALKLEPGDGFVLANDTSEKMVTVEPGQVGGSQFTIEAQHIGRFKLTLSATMKGGSSRADVVVREVEVVPNGREQNLVFNGRLETTLQQVMKFPRNAVAEANTIFVRLYPGPLSQVIEGMDSILRMPGGCFEQTSSSTYPNVLALDYMKRTNKLTPEVHAKAEGYIANGYQRLLTFEVAGGGFSWFGNAPANKILTAYGLMEFSDMAKVYAVDPKLIQRTQDWLAGQQQPDGTWKPDTQFINEGATNRYNTDVLRITAYLAWSLESSGYQGPAVEKAKHYVESHLGAGTAAGIDTYTLAVVANFAADYGKDRDFTGHAMQLLLDGHTEKDEQAWWNEEQTAVYSTGASATIETTALATQALLKWGQASETARKALAFIAAKKSAQGNWGTTQATIMALRALLLASTIGTADVKGPVQVLLDGKTVETLTLNADNNDLLHQFVLKNVDPAKPNMVELKFQGTGGLAYQLVGRYFLPWSALPPQEQLAIDVTYDRTELARNDLATATAVVHNNMAKTANMVMIDLGIPPGFDLLSEDLQRFQESSAGRNSGRLEKFSLTATQAILYFNALAPAETVTLHFRLRAKYPVRAKTFPSRVYEYYDPDVSAIAQPVQLEVKEHQ